MRAIHFKARVQNVAQTLHCTATHAIECRCCFVEHVEVKLTIKHTAIHIACHQLWRTIRFSDLVEVTLWTSQFHSVCQFSPVFFVYVFTCVMTETIHAKLFQPIHCRVNHNVHYHRISHIQCWHKHVKPSCQTVFVPQFCIHASIRQIQWSCIFWVTFIQWVVLMHVVCHIVKQNVDLVVVCICYQLFQFVVRTETAIYLR